MKQLDAPSRTARILIVEDEDLIQMVIASHLEDLGFSVELAGTAAEAKEKMRLFAGVFDAAVIDMGLPDATGDALVSELRPIYPALPIVISSGHDKASMQGKFVDVPLIEFLTKPYTQEQLREALDRVGVDP